MIVELALQRSFIFGTQPGPLDRIVQQSADLSATEAMDVGECLILLHETIVKHFRIVGVHGNQQTQVEEFSNRMLLNTGYRLGSDVGQGAHFDADPVFE